MNILIVEDDPSIQMLLRLSMQVEGYHPIAASTCVEGIQLISSSPVDLIILDLTLPDRSGFEFLQQLRSMHPFIPVIILTAKNEMNDKILGFQLGADDYLTKPFETQELILRIRAVMRRMKTEAEPHTIKLGVLEINKPSRSLSVAGNPIKTTSKEFDLMWLLCSHPKMVFTREQLLDQVWGYEYFGQTRSVDMLVNRLREKLKPHDELIATVHGTGYKLEA
ncbi:response regulator transcription factor [Paenibacillus silviterrae]|uniref:response regulator transcription factor n=1 Tax=Paenibacillus silviterrae TaxID=3242194 RepID=UPI00254361DF|nr:response regulator transcription factor [Paenibacillus chinjuensis]